MTYKSFLLLFCFVFFISACDKNTCDYQTKVLKEELSPDKKLKAVIFEVSVDEGPGRTGNCPGELNNYQSLSILPASEKISEDAKKGTPQKGNAIPHSQALRVRWLSDNEVLVSGSHNDSSDRPKTVNGVNVRYVTDPPQESK